MNKRISITLIALLLVSSVLIACGGPAPVTFSSLPVFTGATETANPLMEPVLTAAVDALKAVSQSAEGKAYDLPEGTTFDAIMAFYKPALEKGGWAVKGAASGPEVVFLRASQSINLIHVEAMNSLIVALATGNK
jgi:hypothetical protein